MPTLARFCVQDRHGRRSSVWRVEVNGDDVYLSSRGMFGQVKASLHASGECHHKLTEPMRRELPPGEERRALDVWRQERGEPGVLEPAYMIYFPGSELLHQDQVIPVSSRLKEITVGVFITELPLPDLEGDLGPLNLLSRLPLKRGAAVDVLWSEGLCVWGRVRSVRKLHRRGRDTRLHPRVISKEWDYAYGFGHVPEGPYAGTRWATEIASGAGAHPTSCRPEPQVPTSGACPSE